MKPLLLILSCVLLLTLSFCGEKDPVHTTQTTSGTEASIGWLDCATFTQHDLTVCFINANEYRCPCNAECFWEGAIDATFHITSSTGIDTTLTLTTNSNPISLPNTAIIGGKTIRFVQTEGVDCSNFGQYQYYKAVIAVE